jgi:hypothetical protein
MAYFSQEDKKKVAPKIKAVLKKYGLNGSVAVDNHTTLVVNIKEGSLDLCGVELKCRLNDPRFLALNDSENVEKPTHIQVNRYYASEWCRRVGEEKIAKFYEELNEATMSANWFDKSDIQTDYFHTAYYIDINVGKWNKPYNFIK